MENGKRIVTDYLIVGSGLAGLCAALRAAEHGSVLMLAKRGMDECNTRYAQGGIACVVGEDDSFEQHVQDTLEAGAGLCRERAVREIVAAGPRTVAELLSMGVHFSQADTLASSQPVNHEAPQSLTETSFDLAREGGHSRRRILHAGDITGEELVRVLGRRCREHPKIEILENYIAVDLISTRHHLDWQMENRCLGLYAIDTAVNQIKTILSDCTILATGGVGKVYLYTSNPDVATGDGLAMAYRAYAEIRNMEFFQFHPTCLYHPKAKSFLISEAVRGEGAKLKIRRGDDYEEFMQRYHPQSVLAARDIVARAIDDELKRTGQPCAWLDIRHRGRSFLERRFPNIFATCLQYGFNLAEDLVPVVPAAHYCCGGVATDLNGRTGVGGLYAVGEVACTGLHGANRLASNSLLEAAVMAHRAVDHVVTAGAPGPKVPAEMIPDWQIGRAVDSDEQVVISHNWEEIRRFMWDYVGIVRTNKRLERAKNRIRMIRREIEKYYWDFIITPDLVELRNLASVAEMIVDCALARRESRGLHFNADYPGTRKQGGSDSLVRRPVPEVVRMEQQQPAVSFANAVK